MRMRTLAATLALAICAPLAHAAPTNYTFDTLTAVTLHGEEPSISGVLRNTTTPVTVSFIERTNVGFQHIINRCVPVFLTMLEKPGRYYLNITVDPAQSNVQLLSCGLELRS